MSIAAFKQIDRSVESSTPIADPTGETVLSTLNDDGSRRWLKPKLSPGRFLARRRIVAYAFIALFAVLPLIHIGGRPIVLLDIVQRRFHIFGATFYPTDTLLLALLLVSIFLTIFVVTAIAGRVWCGWACPQTVYMEFVFRPLERFFQGAPGRAKRGWLQTSGAGAGLKYVAYLAVCFVLAHTFLAYFVSWSELRHWVFGAPSEHLVGFGVVMFVTVAMMFDFSFFREQTCIVACPYGRFQSVLLDRHSLIIGYDTKRGEPRGAKRPKSGDLSLPVLGDCIDCKMCVTTCPTGIDIRNGLQMECIGCAQCIDACDAVMDKIDRPRGLIRYSSRSTLEGKPSRLLRPRVVLYPTVIAVLLGVFTLVLMNTGVAEVTVMRGLGMPFSTLPSGEINNNLRIKLINRLDEAAAFTVAVDGVPGARVTSDGGRVRVPAREMLAAPIQIAVPAGAFVNGRAEATIIVTGPQNYSKRSRMTLLGPSINTPSHAGETKP